MACSSAQAPASLVRSSWPRQDRYCRPRVVPVRPSKRSASWLPRSWRCGIAGYLLDPGQGWSLIAVADLQSDGVLTTGNSCEYAADNACGEATRRRGEIGRGLFRCLGGARKEIRPRPSCRPSRMQRFFRLRTLRSRRCGRAWSSWVLVPVTELLLASGRHANA